jgi:FtsP/CotA-like multicopper oxidase with cupredoxin domain
VLVGLLVTGLLAVVATSWWSSLVPDRYSVMDMGVVELGGGPGDVDHASAHGGHDAVSTADLTGLRDRAPDVAVTLTASRGRFTLATGEQLDGHTVDGASPGPELRVRHGDLVEVTLVNEGVREGVTLHWHGVDLPNAEDGVAGVTQDAVPVGGRHVYRFEAQDAGTYWYHSHQVSHEQVRSGLFGVLVVEPREDDGRRDVVAAVHSYGGVRTLSGRTGTTAVPTPAGTATRVRLLNTDSSPLQAWLSGADFRVLAVDGTDLVGPGPVRDRLLVLAAGGRLDIEVTTPGDGSAVRLDVGGGTALVLGPQSAGTSPVPAPRERLDLLSYGTPAPAPFDVDVADRRFEYRIGRRPGFVDGRPGFWWTVNGRHFPDVPMYVVEEGDVVRMTISNDSGDVHPMHLHGHHALVLRRDGVPSTGSPWWVDSLNVEAGQTWEIAFLADNPGVWMDHCHDLQHAVEGLVAHLAYTGTTTPFRVGTGVGGGAANAPE